MKKIIGIAAIVTLSGCSTTPKPFDWKEFVVPVENGEFVTDVQHTEKSEAHRYALKAVYGACENQRPVILSQETTRTGLLSEKAADIVDRAHYAGAVLGQYWPSINDEEYSAEWLFRCDPI